MARSAAHKRANKVFNAANAMARQMSREAAARGESVSRKSTSARIRRDAMDKVMGRPPRSPVEDIAKMLGLRF